MEDHLPPLQIAPSCHYQRLGVAPGVDAYTLRQAFRRRSKALHPDTTALPEQEARQAFQRLKESYDVLLKLSDSNAAAQPLKPLSKDSRTEPVVQSSAWKGIGERRPLSGGEWFSLLLLSFALLLSLVLGIGVALAQGRQWQVSPVWLSSEQTSIAMQGSPTDVRSAVGDNPSESALPSRP